MDPVSARSRWGGCCVRSRRLMTAHYLKPSLVHRPSSALRGLMSAIEQAQQAEPGKYVGMQRKPTGYIPPHDDTRPAPTVSCVPNAGCSPTKRSFAGWPECPWALAAAWVVSHLTTALHILQPLALFAPAAERVFPAGAAPSRSSHGVAWTSWPAGAVAAAERRAPVGGGQGAAGGIGR